MVSKVMKAMKKGAKGRGKGWRGKVTKTPVLTDDKPITDGVEEVKASKPKSVPLRKKVMERLKEQSLEEVMAEVKERHQKALEAVSSVEEQLKAAEDESKKLTETQTAANLEYEQALKKAKAARDACRANYTKQLEIQKELVALTKAESEAGQELKIVEVESSVGSRSNELEAAKKKVREATEAANVAKQREKELAKEMKQRSSAILDRKRPPIESMGNESPRKHAAVGSPAKVGSPSGKSPSKKGSPAKDVPSPARVRSA